MFKNYIIRDQIYPEETRLENGISQRICVIVKYDYKPMNIFSCHKVNGILISDEMLLKNAKLSGIEYLLIYVTSYQLALELANRWCNEETQVMKNYKVLGIDEYYSVFD